MAEFCIRENRRQNERPTRRQIAPRPGDEHAIDVNRSASYDAISGPQVGLTIYLNERNEWGRPSLWINRLTPTQAREIARMLTEGANVAEAMAAKEIGSQPRSAGAWSCDLCRGACPFTCPHCSSESAHG